MSEPTLKICSKIISLKIKYTLPIVALVFVAACTPKSTLVCNEDIMYDGKLSTTVETCRDYNRVVRPMFTPTVGKGNDNDREVPTVEIDPEDPPTDVPDRDDPPSDPPSDDEPDRVRGDNGWGNGDQSAPGNSGSNNNAENDRGGRTQRNHGQARSN